MASPHIHGAPLLLFLVLGMWMLPCVQPQTESVVVVHGPGEVNPPAVSDLEPKEYKGEPPEPIKNENPDAKDPEGLCEGEECEARHDDGDDFDASPIYVDKNQDHYADSPPDTGRVWTYYYGEGCPKEDCPNDMDLTPGAPGKLAGNYSIEVLVVCGTWTQYYNESRLFSYRYNGGNYFFVQFRRDVFGEELQRVLFTQDDCEEGQVLTFRIREGEERGEEEKGKGGGGGGGGGGDSASKKAKEMEKQKVPVRDVSTEDWRKKAPGDVDRELKPLFQTDPMDIDQNFYEDVWEIRATTNYWRLFGQCEDHSQVSSPEFVVRPLSWEDLQEQIRGDSDSLKSTKDEDKVDSETKKPNYWMTRARTLRTKNEYPSQRPNDAEHTAMGLQNVDENTYKFGAKQPNDARYPAYSSDDDKWTEDAKKPGEFKGLPDEGKERGFKKLPPLHHTYRYQKDDHPEGATMDEHYLRAMRKRQHVDPSIVSALQEGEFALAGQDEEKKDEQTSSGPDTPEKGVEGDIENHRRDEEKDELIEEETLYNDRQSSWLRVRWTCVNPNFGEIYNMDRPLITLGLQVMFYIPDSTVDRREWSRRASLDFTWEQPESHATPGSDAADHQVTTVIPI